MGGKENDMREPASWIRLGNDLVRRTTRWPNVGVCSPEKNAVSALAYCVEQINEWSEWDPT